MKALDDLLAKVPELPWEYEIGDPCTLLANDRTQPQIVIVVADDDTTQYLRVAANHLPAAVEGMERVCNWDKSGAGVVNYPTFGDAIEALRTVLSAIEADLEKEPPDIDPFPTCPRESDIVED